MLHCYITIEHCGATLKTVIVQWSVALAQQGILMVH